MARSCAARCSTVCEFPEYIVSSDAVDDAARGRAVISQTPGFVGPSGGSIISTVTVESTEALRSRPSRMSACSACVSDDWAAVDAVLLAAASRSRLAFFFLR